MTNTESRPTRPAEVGLGLPVYNGQRYLAEAVESLLQQTWTDFTLYISDNGSSDDTQKICENFAATDPRVVYHREPANRGAAWNYNHVREMSTAEPFFKWLADDDLHDPTYLQECMAALSAQPNAVAAAPRSRFIDDEGREVMRDFRQVAWDDPTSAAVRLRAVMLSPHDDTFAFAVMRREALAKVTPFAPIENADGIMQAELVLQGPFVQVDQHLFANRLDSRRSTAATKAQSREEELAKWTSWWGASAKAGGPASAATLRALLAAIAASDLDPLERARCYRVAAVFAARRTPTYVADARRWIQQKRDGGKA